MNELEIFLRAAYDQSIEDLEGLAQGENLGERIYHWGFEMFCAGMEKGMLIMGKGGEELATTSV